MKIAALILLFAGIAIAVLNPLMAFGNRAFGDGGGDLLNGAVAMSLILLGGLLAVLTARKARLAKQDRPQK